MPSSWRRASIRPVMVLPLPLMLAVSRSIAARGRHGRGRSPPPNFRPFFGDFRPFPAEFACFEEKRTQLSPWRGTNSGFVLTILPLCSLASLQMWLRLSFMDLPCSIVNAIGSDGLNARREAACMGTRASFDSRAKSARLRMRGIFVARIFLLAPTPIPLILSRRAWAASRRTHRRDPESSRLHLCVHSALFRRFLLRRHHARLSGGSRGTAQRPEFWRLHR